MSVITTNELDEAIISLKHVINLLNMHMDSRKDPEKRIFARWDTIHYLEKAVEDITVVKKLLDK